MPRPQSSHIGSRLRARRHARGLTLRDVAAEAGVAFSTVAEVERGLHSPTIAVLVPICRALDQSIDELVDEAVTS